MADITLTGTIGRDSEIRFTPSGDALLSFSVADDLRKKNAAGQWETASTTWWPVALWGRQAEALVEHLKRGTRVLVVGTVHERKYEHNGEQRSSFDVKAKTVAVVPRADSPAARSSSGGFDADPWATLQPSTEEAPF